MTDASGFQIRRDVAESYQRETAAFMLPLAHALLEAAGVREGQRVLDLACGPGIASVEAARRVGPSGSVVGVDINEGMIEVARSTPPQAAPMEWQVASAMDLPLEDHSFDVLVCQQGVQFFPDLSGALREMRRVTRPGGVVAATIWSPLDASPYFQALYDALKEAAAAEAAASLVDAFELSRDVLEQRWIEAGLSDVSVTVSAPSVQLPPLDSYVASHLRATPWGPAFDALDPDGQLTFVQRVKDAMADWTVDGVTTVPFSTWVILGKA